MTTSLTVARYSAPAPRRPGRPRRLRVTRRGAALLVRWRAAPGARAYAVTVRARNAPAILRVTRRRSVRIRGLARHARGTVLVGGLRAGTRTGPQARRRIPRRAAAKSG
jgi:hypothetical protein